MLREDHSGRGWLTYRIQHLQRDRSRCKKDRISDPSWKIISSVRRLTLQIYWSLLKEPPRVDNCWCSLHPLRLYIGSNLWHIGGWKCQLCVQPHQSHNRIRKRSKRESLDENKRFRKPKEHYIIRWLLWVRGAILQRKRRQLEKFLKTYRYWWTKCQRLSKLRIWG